MLNLCCRYNQLSSREKEQLLPSESSKFNAPSGIGDNDRMILCNFNKIGKMDFSSLAVWSQVL